MFDRFDDRSRTLMGRSRDAALRLRHDYIAPEHILLALTEGDDGAGGAALGILGVDRSALHDDLAGKMPEGTTHLEPTQLPFTATAKTVLESCVEEAQQLGHRRLGPDHVLLGLLHLESGPVAEVLSRHGVDLQRVRAATAEPGRS